MSSVWDFSKRERGKVTAAGVHTGPSWKTLHGNEPTKEKNMPRGEEVESAGITEHQCSDKLQISKTADLLLDFPAE